MFSASRFFVAYGPSWCYCEEHCEKKASGWTQDQCQRAGEQGSRGALGLDQGPAIRGLLCSVYLVTLTQLYLRKSRKTTGFCILWSPIRGCKCELFSGGEATGTSGSAVAQKKWTNFRVLQTTLGPQEILCIYSLLMGKKAGNWQRSTRPDAASRILDSCRSWY